MSRAYGVGTVYERKDGRWVAQIRDKKSGKTVQRTAKDANTAKKLLRDMASRVDSGKRASDRSVTFRRYAQDWLENRAERGRSAGTVARYERLLDDYVFERIGGKKIGSITEVDVENVLHEAFEEKNLSASTLSLIQKAIAAVLSDAVRSKAVSSNVARSAVIPEQAAKSRPAEMPTTEEVKGLLEETKGKQLGRMIVVLATSGARIGELLGAKWDDLDLDSGLWRITRTTTTDRKERIVLGTTTKSRKVREIVLPPVAVTALREQRTYVLEQRLSTSDWDDHDLLFPTDRGTVLDPSNLRKLLRTAIGKAHKKAVAKAKAEGLPAPRPFPGSFHALRHYFASVTLSELKEAEVQQLLGHSSSQITTSIYGHLTRKSAEAGPSAVARELA